MLTPRLLFQLPGQQRYVGLVTFRQVLSPLWVHSLLYFSLVSVFVFALKIHIYIA
ncbi:hypothetical protein F2Q69_00021363 [Brassica cretica]|uniref:Uncharacterized protein n=1 Tax=Brassica cretica TaxID=69181 RepID=A0A8S9QIA7_BRACR|nr:hypothetical protein F2Q69_00021363 [Brassica cretica]